jgi:hypothetical protein
MGRILIVKVRDKGSRTGDAYKNKINPADPSQLSTVFEDLENLFDVPVRKACRLFLDRGKLFPLSP